MLTEQGRIIAVDSDGVWVETIQRAACDTCSARSGCGQSLLANRAVYNFSEIKAFFSEQDRCTWAVGDQVEIGISEGALVSAALFAYLLPLCSMVFGAYIFSLMGESDYFSCAGALAGLLIGAILARWHSFKYRSSSRYHAVVIQSLNKACSDHRCIPAIAIEK